LETAKISANLAVDDAHVMKECWEVTNYQKSGNFWRMCKEWIPQVGQLTDSASYQTLTDIQDVSLPYFTSTRSNVEKSRSSIHLANQE